jgi:hypothetical protein
MSYIDSGFNKFFCRSIATNGAVSTLQQMSQVSGSKEINFDQSATSGSLGDKIQIGSAQNGIILNGPDVRIQLISDSNNVGLIGSLDV